MKEKSKACEGTRQLPKYSNGDYLVLEQIADHTS